MMHGWQNERSLAVKHITQGPGRTVPDRLRARPHGRGGTVTVHVDSSLETG